LEAWPSRFVRERWACFGDEWAEAVVRWVRYSVSLVSAEEEKEVGKGKKTQGAPPATRAPTARARTERILSECCSVVKECRGVDQRRGVVCTATGRARRANKRETGAEKERVAKLLPVSPPLEAPAQFGDEVRETDSRLKV